MKMTGIIVEIRKDRAIVRTDDNKLIAIKKAMIWW
ncbi:anti-sigma factor domain-containing protein [Acetivibrio straminisolvens]